MQMPKVFDLLFLRFVWQGFNQQGFIKYKILYVM